MTPWLVWYLQKDLEWRGHERERQERERQLRLEREKMARQKAQQQLRAERSFLAWCRIKNEEARQERLEKQRVRAEVEKENVRKEQRRKELSNRKRDEWLQRKRSQRKSYASFNYWHVLFFSFFFAGREVALKLLPYNREVPWHRWTTKKGTRSAYVLENR